MTTPNACRLACHASSDCGDRALCRPIFLDASVTEAPFGACQSFCDPVYGPSCGDGQACRHGYTGAIESPMDVVLRTECGSAGPMRDGDCCVLDVDCEERTTCVPGAGGCAMGQCRPYCYLDDEVPTCAGGTFCQRLAGGPTYDGRELGACQ